MRFTDYLKTLVRDYFIIFAVIVLSITALRQIFVPEGYLMLSDIYNYMVCALASLVFYSTKEIPQKEMNKRLVIHFFVLESALLVLANLVGWVNGMSNTLSLAVQIAVIYMLVRVVIWLGDRKSANNINEKLKMIKEESTTGYKDI